MFTRSQCRWLGSSHEIYRLENGTVFIIVQSFRMTPFVSLKDGTIINLNAIAYIDANSGPTLDPSDADIRIVFPSAWSEVGGTYQTLELTFEGDQAEEFLAELEKRDINVDRLKAARKG